MNEKVEIKGVDTRPEIDPYRRDTLGMTTCRIWIDPRDRTCGVEQDEPGRTGTSSDVWHGRVITQALRYWNGYDYEGDVLYPEAEPLRALLEGDEGQGLLARVCDGHSIEWDGNNMRGRLDDDGGAALSALMDAILQLPYVDDWGTMDAEEYVTMGGYDAARVMGDDWEAYAEEMEAEALASHYILRGDIVDVFEQMRADAIQAAEDDEDDED